MKFTTGDKVKFGDLEIGDMFTFRHNEESVFMKIHPVTVLSQFVLENPDYVLDYDIEHPEDVPSDGDYVTRHYNAVWVRDGQKFNDDDLTGALASSATDKTEVIRLHAE